MAQISKEEIKKLATLARIDLDEKELESFQKDIASILDFVGQVQHASPRTNRSGDGEVSSGQISNKKQSGVWSMIKNKFREDDKPHEGSQFSEDILSAAPQREGNYFKVKKIL